MKLTSTQLTQQLAKVPDWQFENDAIRTTFKFTDFVDAFAFMSAAALHAEKLNHHPTWTNTYNRVDIALSTHEEGGVTELDINLASHLSVVAKQLGATSK